MVPMGYYLVRHLDYCPEQQTESFRAIHLEKHRVTRMERYLETQMGYCQVIHSDY